MAAEGRVALLGAGGTMGLPMARNLGRAGLDVRAWNRSPAKADPLRADSIRIAATPAEAVEGADLVLTMLDDADAVLAAMDGDDGAFRTMGPSSNWVPMSTIGGQGTERCAQLAGQHGTGFLDAPVLGTREPAEQGKLVILASGPSELREDRYGLDLPLPETIQRRLDQGAQRYGDDDMSVTYLTSAVRTPV